jgi:hypothetical protein
MTLDEAIKYCNDVADSQLAEWLQDYKTLKEKATPKSPDIWGGQNGRQW